MKSPQLRNKQYQKFETMLKSTKQFTLSSEAINSHGFKVITSGIDLSHFRNNPLMLWMHSRATAGNSKEILPLGFWDSIKVSEGKVTAVPVFDDKDPFAVAIYHKVEQGTLRMASAGLVPTKWHTSEKVLEESILKEASIVDIGSNAEALAVALYDRDSKVLSLSEAYNSGKIGTSFGLNSARNIQHPLEHNTWQELHMNDKLETLFKERPDLFHLKYKEHFGKEPSAKYLEYLKA